MRQLNQHQTGFTLIELAVTLAIIGLLSSAALPALASLMANSQLRGSADVVVANALLARNEAVKRNVLVNLQISGNNLQIIAQESPEPVVLRSVVLLDTVKVPDFSASFDSAGRLAPFGTQLQLHLQSAKQSCSADLRCPVVRFDAGGSVNICATGVCS